MSEQVFHPSTVVVRPGVPTTANLQNDPWGQPPPGYVPGRGRGATGFAGGVSRDDASAATPAELDRGDYSDARFDAFSGFQEALFGDAVLDEDDKEAERIYEDVERKMDERRKRQRDKRLKEQVERARAEKSTLQQTFSDLRMDLAHVTPEEWDAIPDIGEVRSRKKKRWDRQAPIPEKFLKKSSQYQTSIAPIDGVATPWQPAGEQSVVGGDQTPLGFQTPLGLQTPFGMQTPFGLQTPLGLQTPVNTAPSVSTARGAALSVRLASLLGDNATEGGDCDKEGYLTELEQKYGNVMDSKELQKNRALMKSVVATNATNPSGWLAYARLEMSAGRVQRARDIIAQGCVNCATSEDVWLEAARIQPADEADDWLAAALLKNPTSVKLWVERAKLHQGSKADQLRIYKMALEQVTNSVRLWMEVVNLEDSEENAKTLLLRAIECIPTSVVLWLELVKRYQYGAQGEAQQQEAMRLLNQAGRQCPGSQEIWLAACQLDETVNEGKGAHKMIARAIRKLRQNDIPFERASWIKLAVKSELEDRKLKTAKAIITVIGELSLAEEYTTEGEVDVAKLKNDRLEEVKEVLASNARECAVALLEDGLKYLPHKKAFWRRLLEVYEGDVAAIMETLQRAVKACPSKLDFWVRLISEYLGWSAMPAPADWDGPKYNVHMARETIRQALAALPDNEDLVVLGIKNELRLGYFEDALVLAEAARERLPQSARVRQHLITTHRLLGGEKADHQTRARKLVEDATQEFPKHFKFWLMRAEMEEAGADVLQQGVRENPHAWKLWYALINIYVEKGEYPRARALRERACILVPDCPMLWLIGVKIERLAEKDAAPVMHRGLRQCPKSGLLWAESVLHEPMNTRGSRIVEGLKASDSDVYMVLAAAEFFWREKKTQKARDWFAKAREVAPRNGDVFVRLLEFCLDSWASGGDDAPLRLTLAAADAANLNHGYLDWLPVHKKIEHFKKTNAEKLALAVERRRGAGTPLTWTPEVAAKLAEACAPPESRANDGCHQ